MKAFSEERVAESPKTRSFRDLIVWQKSYQLVLRIYEITRSFPKEENYGLAYQMKKSAVSISSNIAEGYGRQFRKEYTQFLSIAYGSLCELETQYNLSIDLKYSVNNETIEGLFKEVGSMLYTMIKPKRYTLTAES